MKIRSLRRTSHGTGDANPSNLKEKQRIRQGGCPPRPRRESIRHWGAALRGPPARIYKTLGGCPPRPRRESIRHWGAALRGPPARIYKTLGGCPPRPRRESIRQGAVILRGPGAYLYEKLSGWDIVFYIRQATGPDHQVREAPLRAAARSEAHRWHAY